MIVGRIYCEVWGRYKCKWGFFYEVNLMFVIDFLF